jgi:hypothetical protein
MSEPIFFFAQDVYGNQFGIAKDSVVLFYSEIAEIEPIATSLPEWGEVLMADWRGFTGYDLAHTWQVQQRPLRARERLIPKKPFVLGGTYEVANLYAGEIVEAMRFRASLARQITTFRDGTPVNIKVTLSGTRKRG